MLRFGCIQFSHVVWNRKEFSITRRMQCMTERFCNVHVVIYRLYVTNRIVYIGLYMKSIPLWRIGCSI